MIEALIIDDEKNAVEVLEWQLKNYCPNVTVVASCFSADEGIAAIRKFKPQLIFLDIEMPLKNGFDVLESFENPFFDVIFTTAYNQFALKAFRFAALDYLLKPIDAEDLVSGISRFEKKMLPLDLKQQFDLLIKQFRSPESLPEKIGFSTLQAIHFFSPDTILYCEADSNYTTIYFCNQSKMVVTKTLKEVEEMLTPYRFLRIHHSFLINLRQVSRYAKTDGGSIEMSNGSQLPLSRQRKEDILQILLQNMP